MADYIWQGRKIEDITETRLKEELDDSQAKGRFGHYTTARKNLLVNLLPEIAKMQPDLTDHSSLHVKDVLDNAYDLLGGDISKLNSMELYCLIMSIIFHDVGNFFDRDKHRKLISQIYDKARPSSDGGNEDAEEKRIILNICEAHCGKHADGTTINTLQDVIEHGKLERKKIRPKILAPILRLADELAEGEQRTSYYMIKKQGYSKKNMVYHKYASATHVDIDRGGGRIRLTYNVKLKISENSNDPGIVSLEELKDFLPFIYGRAIKLNQERQYAKHYCELLDPFKRTTVTINFLCYEESDFGGYHDETLSIDLKPVEMSDFVVPGDATKSFVEYDASYDPSTLIDSVRETIKTE